MEYRDESSLVFVQEFQSVSSIISRTRLGVRDDRDKLGGKVFADF